MNKFVYDFTEGGRDQKDLLGGKGANLAEMTRLGLPVPPGFTVTTEACRKYLEDGALPPDLRVQVTRALRALEDSLGRQLGDPEDPLLSRDDVEAAFFAAYLDLGVFTVSPFETLDVLGVGRLVQIAVEEARRVKPELKLGVCGEHGGDPESIHFFHRAGLHYVSCSPFRVPVARLEAGRAALVVDDAAAGLADPR
jgi:phosphoenolpyruvate synthase/pyruvate phosphate dikinase